jgi:hypothetical protein
MPRGCKPTGEHALSNAERQASYRARHQAEAITAVTRPRRPIDAAAPSVGVTPSAHCSRCRLSTQTGSKHFPIASKTAPRPTRSKPSSIST